MKIFLKSTKYTIFTKVYNWVKTWQLLCFKTLYNNIEVYWRTKMASDYTQINNAAARQFTTMPMMQNGYNVANLPYRYGQQAIANDSFEINERVDNAADAIVEKAKQVDTQKVKKSVISAVLSVATVVGVTLAVNKNINGIWKAGEKVDTVLKNSKVYNKIVEFGKKIAEKNPLKNSELVKDIKNVTSKSNRVQPKMQMAKMTVLGPKGIFSLTSSEILNGIAKNCGNEAKFTEYLEALVGKDAKICGKTVSETARALFNQETVGESFKFSTELMNAIKSNHGLKTTEDMLKFFDGVKAGKIGEKTFEFAQNVKVRGWAPGTKGNLGETLKKFASMDGQSAQTKIGRFVQQSPLILSESIGNCVNDRTLFGIALGATYLPQNFNEAQDAPKGKKVRTVAAEFVSSAASWAIGMASAGAAVYSLASLKNLKSAGALANVLKKVGSVASIGLGENTSKAKGLLGGAMRFAGVMFLSSKISKPIDNTVKKTFGVPTQAQKDASEKAKQEQEIAQQLGQYGQYVA